MEIERDQVRSGMPEEIEADRGRSRAIASAHILAQHSVAKSIGSSTPTMMITCQRWRVKAGGLAGAKGRGGREAGGGEGVWLRRRSEAAAKA